MASQLVAFADAQVRIVDCPAAIVDGDAVSVTVTGGQVQITEVTGSTSGVPAAVQCVP